MIIHMRRLENGCFDLVNERGEILIAAESYTVCAAIQRCLENRSRWEPSEAYEIAEAIRHASR